MNELARRAVPPAVTPAGVQPRPVRGVTRIDWAEHVDLLGWEVMPSPVRDGLAAAGLCAGDGIAAWAATAGVRDHGNGDYRRYVEGWWAAEHRFVAVQTRQQVTRVNRDGNQFRPSGIWSTQAIVHPINGTTSTQRWRRPDSGHPDGEPGSPAIRYGNHALDLLPAGVRDRLGRPTLWGACRRYPSQGYADQIAAYRRDRDRIVVLWAERRGGAFPDPEAAIDAASWITTFVTGALGRPTTHQIPGTAPDRPWLM